jgi:eukaryotic-like serine/threonine-protein kinase
MNTQLGISDLDNYELRVRAEHSVRNNELAERNLDALMRASKTPLDYELYAGQFRGLAKALAVLHEYAVHRDIKPENILINSDRWLLSDYGLCSFVTATEEDLTQVGRNMGPKFWLSPEAHNHRLGCTDKISEASDVYQLAAVFWYVVTGRHPSGIVEQDDWSGPAKLFDLLHRSLFHSSAKRPKDGTEFLKELEAALST